MNYILNIDEHNLNVDELFAVMHEKLSPDEERNMASFAAQLHERGKLEGQLEGKLKTAERMLEEDINPAFIAKVTELPLDKIKALQKDVQKTD
jgi:predicted transposase YdaD